MNSLGHRPNNRRLWLAYAGGCALAWCLYVLAGSEFDRGLDPFWLAVYQATTMLWAPMLLGIAVWPVARRLHASDAGSAATGMAHVLAAVVFSALWQAGEFAVNAVLFGAPTLNNGLIDTISGSSSLAQSLADTGKGKAGDILPGLLSSSVGDADLLGGTSAIMSGLYNTIHHPNQKAGFQSLKDITGVDISLNALMGKDDPAPKKKANKKK